jgi:urease beta subunit
VVPGEIEVGDGDIEANQGLDTITVRVVNAGDRPIQVGSHYHLFEANPALEFDREKTYGYRIDTPAGTTVRFEPGQVQTLRLVPYRGERILYGFRGYVNGKLDDPNVRARAIAAMKANYNPGQHAQAGRPAAGTTRED